MDNYGNKILCIGAGCNIQQVMHFPTAGEFIFIDSRPLTKNEKLFLEHKFDEKKYITDFVNNLLLSCLYHGFTFESINVLDKNYHKKIISKKQYYISFFKKLPKHINPTVLVFINKQTQQKIRYYISTNINFNINSRLIYDISTSNAILVADYFPEINVLEYFGSSKKFIGYSNVNYQNNVNKTSFQNNIIYFLHNYSCNRPYFFNDFYILENETSIITKCKDFDDFLIYNRDYLDLNKENK